MILALDATLAGLGAVLMGLGSFLSGFGAYKAATRKEPSEQDKTHHVPD
jgi:hypothetical protein